MYKYRPAFKFYIVNAIFFSVLSTTILVTLLVMNILSPGLFAIILASSIALFALCGLFLSTVTITDTYILRSGVMLELKDITSIQINQMSILDQSTEGLDSNETIFGTAILYVFVLIFCFVNWLLSLVFRNAIWTKTHRAIIHSTHTDEETNEVTENTMMLIANAHMARILENLAKVTGVKFTKNEPEPTQTAD